VLVEGLSDKLALEALAARRGADLDAEGIRVVPMGGSKNFASFVQRYGPEGLKVALAGLYDAAEENDVIHALERGGFGSGLTRPGLERRGFFVCVADLEDELIRALGSAKVEQVIDAMGELGSFRTFQKQPAWRGRRDEEQLRRWFGAHASMKIRAAPLLVDALRPADVPAPLDRVLAHVGV
jgi:hypothetical protein